MSICKKILLAGKLIGMVLFATFLVLTDQITDVLLFIKSLRCSVVPDNTSFPSNQCLLTDDFDDNKNCSSNEAKEIEDCHRR